MLFFSLIMCFFFFFRFVILGFQLEIVVFYLLVHFRGAENNLFDRFCFAFFFWSNDRMQCVESKSDVKTRPHYLSRSHRPQLYPCSVLFFLLHSGWLLVSRFMTSASNKSKTMIFVLTNNCEIIHFNCSDFDWQSSVEDTN